MILHFCNLFLLCNPETREPVNFLSGIMKLNETKESLDKTMASLSYSVNVKSACSNSCSTRFMS